MCVHNDKYFKNCVEKVKDIECEEDSEEVSPFRVQDRQ